MILVLILVIWMGIEVVPLIIGRNFDPINVVRIILWVVLIILFLQGARVWL